MTIFDSLSNRLNDMNTAITAIAIITAKLIPNSQNSSVPAINSLVAKTILTTGIEAVRGVNSIPGKKPTIAGRTTTKLIGVMILCASLKLLAYTATGIIIPAKKTVNGNNKPNMSLSQERNQPLQEEQRLN